MRLKDYYKLLEQHDWYYIHADSWRIERQGADNERKLLELATLSTEHQKLYDDYQRYVWSGQPFSSATFPKPEVPKE